jgi:hypothetical protein
MWMRLSCNFQKERRVFVTITICTAISLKALAIGYQQLPKK